jgi:signal transduction histidine kinase
MDYRTGDTEARPIVTADENDNAKATAASHQQQLQKLQEQVQALQDQLRRSQRLAAMGTMTAMVAHEFNNILTPIINYAQMAQKNPALTDKAIARAADGGQRATEICRAILGIARGGGEPALVSLRELIDDMLAATGREPHKDGIELVVDVPRDLTMRIRRVELQQVLLNLYINARAAVLAKTWPRRIELAAKRVRKNVVITVRDSGVGIEPGDIERVFEPFFTTKAEGGSGLGLTICRDIIRTLGGEISLKSTPGQGADFTIRLPAEPVGVDAAGGNPLAASA